mmetsp:Transcript_22806/g.57688  ORF Transcript_22806/g.57688 Transcript_22806/m.57688 type:complete len:521 (-) Transcript_22806:21-1583(-)
MRPPAVPPAHAAQASLAVDGVARGQQHVLTDALEQLIELVLQVLLLELQVVNLHPDLLNAPTHQLVLVKRQVRPRRRARRGGLLGRHLLLDGLSGRRNVRFHVADQAAHLLFPVLGAMRHRHRVDPRRLLQEGDALEHLDLDRLKLLESQRRVLDGLPDPLNRARVLVLGVLKGVFLHLHDDPLDGCLFLDLLDLLCLLRNNLLPRNHPVLRFILQLQAVLPLRKQHPVVDSKLRVLADRHIAQAVGRADIVLPARVAQYPQSAKCRLDRKLQLAPQAQYRRHAHQPCGEVEVLGPLQVLPHLQSPLEPVARNSEPPQVPEQPPQELRNAGQLQVLVMTNSLEDQLVGCLVRFRRLPALPRPCVARAEPHVAFSHLETAEVLNIVPLVVGPRQGNPIALHRDPKILLPLPPPPEAGADVPPHLKRVARPGSDALVIEWAERRSCLVGYATCGVVEGIPKGILSLLKSALRHVQLANIVQHLAHTEMPRTVRTDGGCINVLCALQLGHGDVGPPQQLIHPR